MGKFNTINEAIRSRIDILVEEKGLDAKDYPYSSDAAMSLNQLKDILGVEADDSQNIADALDSVLGAVGSGSGGGSGGSDGDFVALVERTISMVDNSEITHVGYGAFNTCSNLTTVNLPACTTMEQAFANCSKLTTVNLPALKSLPYNAFAGASRNLSSITFTQCETIGASAFYSCKQLQNVNFPSCKTIGSNAFYYCIGLVSNISFPVCETINGGAFNNCFYITTLSFPACTRITGQAFRDCSMLTSVYFLGSSVPSMDSTYVFYSTPIYGYTTFTSGEYGSIFVKQSMLSAFMSATNWSFFSERMVGLTDEEIAALDNE